jgi:hypothetical protein
VPAATHSNPRLAPGKIPLMFSESGDSFSSACRVVQLPKCGRSMGGAKERFYRGVQSIPPNADVIHHV